MGLDKKGWSLLYFIINIIFVILFAAYLLSGTTTDNFRLFMRSVFLAIAIVNAIRYGIRYFEARKEE